MSVHIRLTSNQFEQYQTALKKAKIPFDNEGTVIALESYNVNAILEALKAAHLRSFETRTKVIAHMERLFFLEQVIKMVTDALVHFPPTKLDPNKLTSLDDLLAEDGILEECTEDAIITLSTEYNIAA